MDVENLDLRREVKTFKVFVGLCEERESFPFDTDMAKVVSLARKKKRKKSGEASMNLIRGSGLLRDSRGEARLLL